MTITRERPLVDLAGKTFGMLKVIAFAGSYKKNPAALKPERFFTCQCICGKRFDVRSASLLRGKARSCGSCIRLGTKHHLTHGMRHTSEYNSWAGIKQRCTNPKSRAYKDYGGRGITMCERWLKSFENFFADMGRRPSKKHEIDRIDNNGNYEPGNCHWATDKQQARNRRNSLDPIEYNGESRLVNEWADAFGISAKAVRERIFRYGWTVHDALTTPVKTRGHYRKAR